ncbi:MAG TPA: TIM barrel protein [Gemmataceae bacterium]|nr:TIM barrel protein [Gemmataceae bacterium]
MKDSWQSYLQLGVVHFMAFPECLTGEGPQLDTLAAICHDPFFDAVDVGPIVDDLQRAECAALLRDCQMHVTFACQPLQLLHGHDLNAADKSQRKAAIEAVLGCFEQAQQLGASRIAVMSGRNVAAAERPAALDCLIQSLCTLCHAARNRVGLPMVLEIFDHDLDKKALVGPCATAAAIAREVRREFSDFGLLHDLSHIYLCHEEPAQHFPLIREHLVAMHMGNSVSDSGHALFGDTHPLFGMPGSDSSAAELREFLRVLFDIGFLRPGRRPVCGFEIRPPAGVSPQTAIVNMKRTWQQAWWTL